MIIVTGGSGQAGKACVRDLLEHGYDLASVDLAPPVDTSVRFSRVDLTDFGQTMAALSAIDERVTKVTGIVHLAAIRAPGLAPNHITFETNILSTYNVFEASRQLGIKNIVWASSETVLGLPFATPPAAQAFRLALESSLKGAEIFVIANADTVMNRSNEELLSELYAGVPRKREFGPNETLLSIEKARRVLGYAPRYGWCASSK